VRRRSRGGQPDSRGPDDRVPDDERRRRFEELVDANYAALLGYALRRVDQPADAADVVCDVFLVTWRRIEEVPDGEEGTLWLYGVARRTVANSRRGLRRRRALHERLRSQVAAVDLVVPEPRVSESIGAALARLSDDDRELLALTAWEGLSPAQIATVLDIDAGTVRVRLHRARRRLKTLLDDDPPAKRTASSGHMAGGRAPAGPSTRKAP
jgi:RNA polymerase sigma-70 factor (ECF subfamily)